MKEILVFGALIFFSLFLFNIALMCSDTIATRIYRNLFVYPKHLKYESFCANIPPFGFKLFIRILFILLSSIPVYINLP